MCQVLRRGCGSGQEAMLRRRLAARKCTTRLGRLVFDHPRWDCRAGPGWLVHRSARILSCPASASSAIDCRRWIWANGSLQYVEQSTTRRAAQEPELSDKCSGTPRRMLNQALAASKSALTQAVSLAANRSAGMVMVSAHFG